MDKVLLRRFDIARLKCSKKQMDEANKLRAERSQIERTASLIGNAACPVCRQRLIAFQGASGPAWCCGCQPKGRAS